MPDEETTPVPAEPVAIIGLGCRLPGDVGSPEELWRLMQAGTRTADRVPADRWDWYRGLGPEYDAALRRAVAFGNFLDGIEDFDAGFFGLTPREAELMDPLQRILLETSWTALEQAGLPPHSLAGTDTGVYVGVCTSDYGRRLLEDLPGIEAWTGIGAAGSAAADRVSYTLDLRGPSLVVDTACSASLVALHLACQALRSGECDTAIAAGVNVLASPGETLSLDAAGALSPDGTCRPFDAEASGYGRGEGCGVLLVKRLSDARRDGDRVLALVRGSAISQDGHTAGIMAASPEAQQRVMRAACARAGFEPRTVDYVEAHGTGTRVGDPVEAEALSAVYGAGRDEDDPCLIGSVKSNIGHLEGAAGVSGLIKATLALSRAEIPATVLGELNPDIPWDDNGLRVVTAATAWPGREHARRAAVSGFGYGGSVAHVVLEAAAPAYGGRAGHPQPTPDEQVGGPLLYPISAASPAGLATAAARLADTLAASSSAPSPADVGHTLALRRSHLAHRAVVRADTRDELVAGLRRVAAGETGPGTVAARTPASGPAPAVWVFSGHGSQWAGMGRELLDDPTFAAVVDACEPTFLSEIGFSPRRTLLDGELDGVDRTQTMIFVMQVGLAAVWRSRGAEPAAVIGHSVGEVAAAVVAGALSLDDGAVLICRRSVLLREALGQGAMAMVGRPFAEVARRLSGQEQDVVAAISASPVSTVVSGTPAAVRTLSARYELESVPVRPVASDVAFHSPQMDPLAERLAMALEGMVPEPRQVPMYLTAVQDARAAVPLDGAYWARNLREPVLLTAAVAAAAQDGHEVFLEISPHPVVAHSIAECLEDAGQDTAHVGWTLRRDLPEREAVLDAIARAHCHGVPVDWSTLARGGDLTDLPAPAWDRRRLWREPTPISQGAVGAHDVASHTVLGAPLPIAGSDVRVWQSTVDDDTRPYPGSHAIVGTEIVPAAVLVQTFLAAAGTSVLRDVVMSHPLVTGRPQEVQVVAEGSRLRLATRGLGADGESWLVHTSATYGALPARPAPAARSRSSVTWDQLPRDHVSSRLAAVGVPSTGFPWGVAQIAAAPGRIRTRVRVEDTSTWASVLDAVMTVAPCTVGGAPELRMVVAIDEVAVRGQVPHAVVIETVLDPEREDVVDAVVADTLGEIVATVRGMRYPVVDRSVALPTDAGADGEATGPGELAGLSAEETRAAVLELVRHEIAEEMHLALGDLDVARPLAELGLDSVMTVVIRRRLGTRLGLALPATLFWQHPTARAVADHVVTALAEAASTSTDIAPSAGVTAA